MSDVIKFEDIKNKARDKDVNQFEDYIFKKYYEVAEGKMSMADLNRDIMQYMSEHDISQEKFSEIQIKLMERYGYDAEEFKKLIPEIKDSPLNVGMTLKAKYGNSLEIVSVLRKTIKNEKNDLILYCEGDDVTILSEKEVDLEDNELHDFLVSYRRQHGEEQLKIKMGDSLSEFIY